MRVTKARSGFPEAIEILGVPVHDVDEQQALDLMVAFIDSGRPHQVATVNPEFIIRARRDAEFFDILRRADLCLPDGVGVVWAGCVLGRPFKARVTGVDTVRRLAAVAAQRGYRLFLLGAAPGVAGRTARLLEADHPGLVVAGTYSGSPAIAEEAAIVERIRATQSHVVLVAYGAPSQDKWLYRNLARSGASLGMGVGGAFDFICGASRRAPAWMQDMGMEWLHRLYCEPWRWRRMTALPQFAGLVLWQRLRGGRV
jgi:N-acetylglucosaminyldiphosphoundecaprenol N-acetyl-beta-D-mannosaminyltransferase